MDIRDGHPTRSRFALHKIDIATGNTFCRCVPDGWHLLPVRRPWLIEVEEDGQREAWRAAVQDHRSCYNCAVALERMAENS